MMRNFWQRVLNYRYDPLATEPDGRPIGAPKWAERLGIERSVVWIAAIWFVLIGRV